MQRNQARELPLQTGAVFELMRGIVAHIVGKAEPIGIPGDDFSGKSIVEIENESPQKISVDKRRSFAFIHQRRCIEKIQPRLYSDCVDMRSNEGHISSESYGADEQQRCGIGVKSLQHYSVFCCGYRIRLVTGPSASLRDRPFDGGCPSTSLRDRRNLAAHDIIRTVLVQTVQAESRPFDSVSVCTRASSL